MSQPLHVTPDALKKALEHAINYHGIDARANMSDFAIAELISDEVLKHIRGETDVQRYEAGERPKEDGQ